MKAFQVYLGTLFLLGSLYGSQGLYCEPALVAPTNGFFTCTDGDNFGSICTFQCNSTDYRIVGAEQLVCYDNADTVNLTGVWTSTEPMCEWTGLKDSCTDNNGGCSNQCIGGSSPVSCGCPCGASINADGMQCDSTNPCDVDILLLIDYSDKTDPIDCQASSNQNWNAWQVWKAKAVEVIDQLFAAYPTARLAVQSYANGVINTINTFTDGKDAASIIAAVNAANQPDCGSLTSFTTILSGSLPVGIRESASKFAFVVSAGTDETLNDASISANMQIATQKFDSIVVLTDFDNITNVESSRFAVCGNKTSLDCGYVFNLEGFNDLSALASTENFKAVAKPDACLDRISTTNVDVTSCAGSIQSSIPQCLLRGMPSSALVASDLTCTNSGFISSSSNNYLFNMQYGDCNMAEVFDETQGTVTYTQALSSDPSSPIDTYPDIEIAMSCVVSAFSAEEAMQQSLQPKSFIQTSGISADGGMYTINVAFYSDPAFTQPIQPGAAVTVTDVIYVETSTPDVPNDSHLQLNEIKATSSSSYTDATAVLLVENGCPLDTTFANLTDGTVGGLASNRFQFEMFQFTSTARKVASSKLKVYLHISYYVCLNGDSSARCSPACAGRKRRSVSGDDPIPVLRSTIGPFTVNPKTSTKTNSEHVDDHTIIESESPHSCDVAFIRSKLFRFGNGFSIKTNCAIMIVIVVLMYLFVHHEQAKKVREENHACCQQIVSHQYKISDEIFGNHPNLRNDHSKDRPPSYTDEPQIQIF